MSFEIIALPHFRKELKKLAKKYPSVKEDFRALLNELKNNPKAGVSLGMNCFKIRMAITSKGKGKSGGSRVITCVLVAESTVYLLTIFDKSEKENITDKELKEILSYVKD